MNHQCYWPREANHVFLASNKERKGVVARITDTDPSAADRLGRTKLGVTPLEGLSQVSVVVGASGHTTRLARIRRSLVAFLETFRLALDSLQAHKLRSFLTLLGVILAVTTLVVVMSVVAGMNFYVADRIANLGANVFIVDRFGIITSNDKWVKAQKRPLLTMDEFEYLRDNMK